MNKFLKNTLFFLLILGVLSVAFLPALTTTYVFHDDVNYFLKAPTRIIPVSQVFNFAVGRYLGAAIITGLSQLVDQVSDLKLIRFLCVVQVALSAFCVFLVFRRAYQHWLPAVAISLLIFTLPSFQIMVSYAGIAFHCSAVLLSALAALCAMKIPTEGKLPKRIFSQWSIKALIYLLCAWATYPPTATFYWFVAAVVLFTLTDSSAKRGKIINFFSIGILSLGLYAGIVKIMQPFFGHYGTGAYNPNAYETDIIGKLQWFLNEPLINALNLWNIFPQPLYTTVIDSLLGLALIIILFSRRRSLAAKELLTNSVLVVVLVFLSFLPNLIAQGEAPYYRCIVTIASLIILFLIIGWDHLCRLLPQKFSQKVFTSVLIVFALYGTTKSLLNISAYRSVPSQVEYEYLYLQFKTSPLNEYKRIHFVRPAINGLHHRYDEFGTPTTYYAHDHVGLVATLLQEIAKENLDIYEIDYVGEKQLLRLAFTEKKDFEKFRYFQIRVTSSENKENLNFDNSTLVVDMSGLYGPHGPLAYLKK